MNLSMQMYSLKDEGPFRDVIRRIAEIGYDGVELARYHNTDIKEMKQILDEYGMKVVGNHLPQDAFTGHLEEEIEKNRYLGCDNLVVADAWFQTLNEVKKTADMLYNAAEVCVKYGFTLSYHNHDFEFQTIDGRYLFDYLMDLLPENMLRLEFDVFWMKYAGIDVNDYLERYKNRCVSIHLKDLKNLEDKSNISLGEGMIDFRTIIDTASGVNFIYERENDRKYPWEQMKLSHDYFRKMTRGR